MKYRKIGEAYLVKPDVGEDIIVALGALASELGVASGEVSGIGGVEGVVLGYYDLDAKVYCKKPLAGRYELVSLAGNVSLVDGKPFVHAHAVVTGPDMAAYGGHLFSATVAVTAELWLRGSTERIARSQDDAVGLKTLDL